MERFAAAKGRSRTDPAWTQKVGFVERHHGGHLVLRGTFAGHYVYVDESDHISELGAGETAAAAAVVGAAVAGPPGIALGLLLGAIVGSQAAKPTEVESEPETLVERLREVVAPSSSAIVMIAPASDVEEMLAALGDTARATVHRSLSDAEAAALQASLGDAPAVSTGP